MRLTKLVHYFNFKLNFSTQDLRNYQILVISMYSSFMEHFTAILFNQFCQFYFCLLQMVSRTKNKVSPLILPTYN